MNLLEIHVECCEVQKIIYNRSRTFDSVQQFEKDKMIGSNNI